MPADNPDSFDCPKCNAFYHVVRVESGPETVDHQVTCAPVVRPLLAVKVNLSSSSFWCWRLSGGKAYGIATA
jgi:hypothetical protein